MKTYILKRLLLMAPTLVGITLLTYGIVRLAPGDPVEAMIRAQSTNIDPKVMWEDARRIRERLGLMDYNLWGPDVGSLIDRLREAPPADRQAVADDLRRVTHVAIDQTPAAWQAWWDNNRVDALIAGLKTALEDREDALRRLVAQTGQSFGADPAAWRAWWQANRQSYVPAQVKHIGGLIERLAGAAPEDRPAIAERLGVLTGEDLGPNPEAWSDWWQKRSANFAEVVERRVTGAIDDLAVALDRARQKAEALAEATGESHGEDVKAWEAWWQAHEAAYTEQVAEPVQKALLALSEAAAVRDDTLRRLKAFTGADESPTVEAWSQWWQAHQADYATNQAAEVETLLKTLRTSAAGAAEAGRRLETLTGERLAVNPAAWEAWWRQNQGRVEKDQIDWGEKFLNVFIGYGQWVANLVTGNLGESIKFTASNESKNPAMLFYDRLPVTVTLNILADTLIFLVAIPMGLVAARRQGGLFDRASTVVLLVLYSLPVILAGTLMIAYLAKGGRGVAWFPLAGLHSNDVKPFDEAPFAWLLDLGWHAVLPVVCLVYGGLAYLAKLGRASLLENLRSDFVRTARAKGLPERRVVYHHALRNGLLPMITVMVLTLPGLLGGSVIVETIFSIQGMGLLMVEAAKAYDLAVIMFGTLVFGTLTLVFLLIGDILYAWADPRVRYG